MDRRRQARPGVEAMESKHLLTAVALNGTLRGWQTTREIAPRQIPGEMTPDFIAIESSMIAAGRLGGLGEVRLSNSTAGPIVLSNTRGSLTLWDEMVSNVPFGHEEDQYLIVSGTGAYRGATGSGVLTIVNGPTNGHEPQGRTPITIHFTPN